MKERPAVKVPPESMEAVPKAQRKKEPTKTKMVAETPPVSASVESVDRMKEPMMKSLVSSNAFKFVKTLVNFPFPPPMAQTLGTWHRIRCPTTSAGAT